jgi:hypothetical protein
LRLQTFEDKRELGASWTIAFLAPSHAAHWMLKDHMTVKKKSDRNNKGWMRSSSLIALPKRLDQS